ncbi:SDR family NAD(P)-dependent oxidoreductase [Fictibacillus terranigra]|uniref:SDR family oxidoreductase n=1 Tax=Fictibacillus terranigra TaxID=3058424 RepID=A0ABT8EBE1_9BACL|nr:SDR family oxidoreductase [Fictibacillus sp. CENA-BCM004]MDN4075242.1 SDR family oxidoreductase [Fictibacillus sp. CENA-BCM004]
MNLYLENKRVLITGGSKGLGKGIAKLFMEEGASVGICGRSQEALEHTRAELGSELLILQGDVTSREDRERILREFTEEYGGIDILVNNAGGSNGSAVLETSMEEFEEAFHLNYLSAVGMSKLAAEHMIKNEKGTIINISSIFGRESGGKPTYNASKAALISFTKSFADEMIRHGVRVSGVAPGSVLHPTGNWQKRLQENPDQINQYVQQNIPAQRFGTVEEIANTVVFLSSERASWVVGATLNVDGGQSYSNF